MLNTCGSNSNIIKSYKWLWRVGRGEVGFPALSQERNWEEGECRQLPNGTELITYQGQCSAPAALTARIVAEEPCFLVRVPTQGKARASMPFLPADLKESAHCYSVTLFRTSSVHIEVQPGEAFSLVAMAMPAGSLRSMVEGHDVPDTLRQFLDGKGGDFAATYPTSARLRRIVASLRATPHPVGMKGLFLQAKVYELLAEVIDTMGAASSGNGSSVAPDTRRALQARDILLADMANPPSIGVLAKQVGMSQRRLNDVFRDQFGDSPFQCLVRWRMEAAAEMLGRQDISIKEVAFQLGYGHVNNFIAAFSRHMGVSPRRYRDKVTAIT